MCYRPRPSMNFLPCPDFKNFYSILRQRRIRLWRKLSYGCIMWLYNSNYETERQYSSICDAGSSHPTRRWV
jgi:hypothetical protein